MHVLLNFKIDSLATADGLIVPSQGRPILYQAKSYEELRQERTGVRGKVQQLNLYRNYLVHYAQYVGSFPNSFATYTTDTALSPTMYVGGWVTPGTVEISAEMAEYFLGSQWSTLRVVSVTALVALVRTGEQLAKLRERLRELNALIEAILRHIAIPAFLKAIFEIERTWFVSNVCHPPRFLAAALNGLSAARASLPPSAA